MKKLCIVMAMLAAFIMTTSAQNTALPPGYTTCENCGTNGQKKKIDPAPSTDDNSTTKVKHQKVKTTHTYTYRHSNATAKNNCNTTYTRGGNQQNMSQGNQGNGTAEVMITSIIVGAGMQALNRYAPMGGNGMMPMYNNGMYNNGLLNNGMLNNGMYNNGLLNNNGMFNNGMYSMNYFPLIQ